MLSAAVVIGTLGVKGKKNHIICCDLVFSAVDKMELFV